MGSGRPVSRSSISRRASAIWASLRAAIFLEASPQQRSECRRRARWQSGPVRFAAHDGSERIGDCHSRERTLRRQHLVQQAAERPDVASPVKTIAHGLLGADVSNGPNEHAFFRPSERQREIGCAGFRGGIPRERRDAEVQHLDRAGRGNRDVRGLQIAMNDPLAVRGLERRGDAGGAPKRVAHRHRSPKEALLQRLSFDQLKNQEWRALSLDDIEEGADVGMVDLRDQARFAFEAREAVRIVGEGCGENLDGDIPAQACIARAIHLAHGAVTNQTDNLIRPEPVARL